MDIMQVSGTCVRRSNRLKSTTIIGGFDIKNQGHFLLNEVNF